MSGWHSLLSYAEKALEATQIVKANIYAKE